MVLWLLRVSCFSLPEYTVRGCWASWCLPLCFFFWCFSAFLGCSLSNHDSCVASCAGLWKEAVLVFGYGDCSTCLWSAVNLSSYLLEDNCSVFRGVSCGPFRTSGNCLLLLITLKPWAYWSLLFCSGPCFCVSPACMSIGGWNMDGLRDRLQVHQHVLVALLEAILLADGARSPGLCIFILVTTLVKDISCLWLLWVSWSLDPCS